MWRWFRRSDRRVSFVIAGVQKGGTTALYAQLLRHPAISMPRRKECHYFDMAAYFARPDTGVSAYHAMFPGFRRGQLRGEATPAYVYCRAAPRRMMAYNPDLRVIVLLRDPVERAYSHWHMEKHRGMEELSFGAAIRAEPARLRLEPEHPVYSYMDRGFYARQLLNLWEHVPREQTLIVRSEMLRTAPEETVGTVCRFLGVAPFSPEGIIRQPMFAQQYRHPVDASLRAELGTIFASDIRRLEDLLGWDCSGWLCGGAGE